MKKIAFLALPVFLMTGCVSNVHKEMHATGGSKSDGVIELSYEYGEFERPIIDEEKSTKLAEMRCKSWGYSKADAFGGVKQQCQMFGGMSGCARFLVTKQYQCLD